MWVSLVSLWFPVLLCNFVLFIAYLSAQGLHKYKTLWLLCFVFGMSRCFRVIHGFAHLDSGHGNFLVLFLRLLAANVHTWQGFLVSSLPYFSFGEIHILLNNIVDALLCSFFRRLLICCTLLWCFTTLHEHSCPRCSLVKCHFNMHIYIYIIWYRSARLVAPKDL